jgi:hypothetical protein
MRVLVLLLVVACSKPSNERAHESPGPAPRAIADATASRFPVRQLQPQDPEIVEEWVREIGDPHLRSVHGVSASKSRSGKWSWSVMVDVMEFIRDVPLETQLRDRIMLALHDVPGVVDVMEGDRELWLVRGEVSGEKLVNAVSPVVDELAVQSRQEIDRQVAQ